MLVLRNRVAVVAAAVVLVSAATAGCSNSRSVPQKRPHTGSGTASIVNGVQQITVLTGTDLRFHPSTLIVHPGPVRIVLINRVKAGTTGPPHNLQVTGLPGAAVPLVPAGDEASVTFTAGKPGHYHFVCTIHVQQGQTGTLIVEPGSAG